MKLLLAKDLRKEDFNSLLKQVSDLKRELMNLRFQKSNGQLSSQNSFKITRRNIARIKTVLTENSYNSMEK
jgi:large subunit ribosomal protein L29